MRRRRREMPHWRCRSGKLHSKNPRLRCDRLGFCSDQRNMGANRYCPLHRSSYSSWCWCWCWGWCWCGIRYGRGGCRRPYRGGHPLLRRWGGRRHFRDVDRRCLWRRRGCDGDVLNQQRLQVFVIRHIHPWRDNHHSPQGRKVQECHQRGTAQPVRTTAWRIVQAGGCQGANTSAPATETLDKPWRRLLARTWTNTP